MEQNMKYTPKQNKKLSITLSAICLIFALSLVGFSSIAGDFLSKLFIIISTLPFIASIFVISRYLTYNYIYETNDDELIITKTKPNYNKTVCRLCFHHITDVQKTTSARLGKRYNYCANIFCKNKYSISFTLGDEKGEVIIEADAFFIEHLEKFVKCDIILE